MGGDEPGVTVMGREMGRGDNLASYRGRELPCCVMLLKHSVCLTYVVHAGTSRWTSDDIVNMSV